LIIRAPQAYLPTANQLRTKLADHAPTKLLYWAQTVPATAPPDTLGIHRLLDKPAQLAAFRRAGLETPDFTTDLREAIRWLRQGRPVIGRTRFGTHGQGIRSPGRRWRAFWTGARHYAPTHISYAWRHSQWWSVLVTEQAEPDNYDEYRFHVVNNCSIQRAKKIRTAMQDRSVLPIRNRRCGWTLCRDCALPTADLRDAAKKAVEAVGYPWGAVDLIHIPATNQVLVLEVNTSPGMDARSATLWATAIRKQFPEGTMRAS